jgi:hypothetical protein
MNLHFKSRLSSGGHRVSDRNRSSSGGEFNPKEIVSDAEIAKLGESLSKSKNSKLQASFKRLAAVMALKFKGSQYSRSQTLTSQLQSSIEDNASD